MLVLSEGDQTGQSVLYPSWVSVLHQMLVAGSVAALICSKETA